MRPILLAGLIILVVGGFHATTLREGHDWGDDFSLYIRHAQNLAEGRPYAETGYLYNPKNPIGPSAAPPVFPWLLAPVYRWAGLDLEAFKLVPLLCFLVFLGAMFAAFRRRLPDALAVTAVAIVGFNPLFWAFKDHVLSDFPFLCFAYLSFFCIERIRRARDRRQTGWALAAGASLYLAAGTREVGLLLPASWWAADLCTDRRVTPPALIATAVCALLLALQAAALPELGSQGSRLGQAPHMISSHLSCYSKELRDLWRNGYSGFLMRALFLSVNGLAVLGYAARLRLGPTAAEVFPVLYVAVILLWPDFQGIRYLFPVVPLYVFYALDGLRLAAERLRRGSAARAAAVLLALIAASYAARYTTLDFGPLPEGMARPETRELFAYLASHTPRESLIACAKPRATALFTGRRTTVYHWTEGEEGMLRSLDEAGADYAVTSPLFFSDQQWFQPMIDRHPDRFEEVYGTGGFRVYRIRTRPVMGTKRTGIDCSRAMPSAVFV
jgi:hypothetical protein